MSEYVYGQASKTNSVTSYPARRTCSESSCSTTLSIYNPSAYCWLHERFAPRPRLSPKRG